MRRLREHGESVGGSGMIRLIETIITEMTKGNFSFLILVVGVLQLVVMWRKK